MNPNPFTIRGKSAYITLTDRKGHPLATAVVDASDAETVIRFGRWRRLGNGYVATSRFDSNGKRTEVYLHRLLSGATAGQVVDHINGDPLDNRMENLRLVAHSENMQNQKRLRSDSSTGVRNVSYGTKDGRYKVVIAGHFFGRYNSLERAASVAERNRQKVMPYAETVAD